MTCRIGKYGWFRPCVPNCWCLSVMQSFRLHLNYRLHIRKHKYQSDIATCRYSKRWSRSSHEDVTMDMIMHHAWAVTVRSLAWILHLNEPSSVTSRGRLWLWLLSASHCACPSESLFMHTEVRALYVCIMHNVYHLSSPLITYGSYLSPATETRKHGKHIMRLLRASIMS